MLRDYPGLGWISALCFTAIRDLVEAGVFQPSLFDTQNLAEITREKGVEGAEWFKKKILIAENIYEQQVEMCRA